MKEELIFPCFIYIEDSVYTVKGYSDTSELKIGKGYINDNTNTVYIFTDALPTDENKVPYCWYNDSNKLEYSLLNDYTKEKFSIENILNIDPEITLDNGPSKEEELYNIDELQDMNASTSKFVPTIEDGDDFLKKMVKQAIISKNIDVKRLQHKLNNTWDLSNLIGMLKGRTKMSTDKFARWCEILGISYKLTICDSGMDAINPLKSVLEYDNETDMIYTKDKNE